MYCIVSSIIWGTNKTAKPKIFHLKGFKKPAVCHGSYLKSGVIILSHLKPFFLHALFIEAAGAVAKIGTNQNQTTVIRFNQVKQARNYDMHCRCLKLYGPS
jgi:hypothetical protein